MTDLTLVYRASAPSRNSIERLFGALQPHWVCEFKVHRLEVPAAGTSLSDIFKNIAFVRKHAKGVVHVTGDINYIAGFMRRRPTVLTIHDCGNWMNLRGLKRHLFRWLWYGVPAKRAACLTAVSQSTKDVLTAKLGISSDRVLVIDNCITTAPPTTKRSFDSNRPKILQIGSGPHKNLAGLIQAVQGRNCELVIVGSPSSEDRGALLQYRIPHSIETQVNDERIEALYGEVDILFFASFHEGFGLPILEAQAAGVPVITSNLYSMPHVAGHGAWIVSPHDSNSIRQAIDAICCDEATRLERVANGKSNIARFHPAKIAGQYKKVYQRLSSCV